MNFKTIGYLLQLRVYMQNAFNQKYFILWHEMEPRKEAVVGISISVRSLIVFL